MKLILLRAISFLLLLMVYGVKIEASQYAPNIYFARPLNEVPYATNTPITFSAGFAKSAFDNEGNHVPFLQQYGNEDFLDRFINPSLGQDNTDSQGQGHISGTYHFKQFRFACTKKIYHYLFFGITTAFQDLSITNITPDFLNSDYPLSSDQANYLVQLKQVVPSSIYQSGMYTTNIYFGYCENKTSFNHINAISYSLSVGISSPQAMSDTNQSIFQFPCAANYHFGYPVVGAVDVEINNFFSLGGTGLVVPFQPATRVIPINDPTTNNHLLFTDSTLAVIDQNPLLAGTLYVTLHNTSQKYTATIAYCYVAYLHSIIKPVNTSQFPEVYAHRSILLSGYTLGSLLLQFDIDCTSDTKKLAPVVSFFFSVPLAGQFYQQTYLFGGACNLQITYGF